LEHKGKYATVKEQSAIMDEISIHLIKKKVTTCGIFVYQNQFKNLILSSITLLICVVNHSLVQNFKFY